jgi:nucleotide-binding universal stress UspA family protein
MKTIVIPINFSSCAANAARYAADLAQVIHADLHLIHVIQVPVNSAELMMTQSVYEEMVEFADIALKQLQFELIKRTNNRIKVDTTLGAGNLAAKVQVLCQQVKPYAIVLGAAGPSLEKFLAGGSVASLLNNPDYPVLVVPEKSEFQQFRRILLACDLEDIGSDVANSLPLIKELQEKFGSRIDIVNVKTSRVEEGVLEYLGLHEADLIMVFPKEHGFFDFHTSKSRKLAQHSPVPVMSVHV